MKTYIAQRPPDDEIGDCRITVQEANGRTHPLHHVQHHSDGLEWGYGGSGPADTALSILADYFGERPTRHQLREGHSQAWLLHQKFKWRFIAPAPRPGFRITEQQITDWLASGGRE